MDIMNRKNVTLIMGIMIRNTKLVGNCKCMDLLLLFGFDYKFNYNTCLKSIFLSVMERQKKSMFLKPCLQWRISLA